MKSLMIGSFLLLGAVLLSAAEIAREPGRVGKALRLKSGEYVESLATRELNCPDQVTVAFWVKADEWGQMSSLVYKGGSYGIMKRGGHGIYFWGHFSQWDAINMSWVPEKYFLNPGQWYHLAMTYDSATTQGQTFLNGKRTGGDLINQTQPQLGTYKLYPTDRPLTIGKGVQPFGGLIDSVYVYDRVLSEAEIQQLMREETVPGAKLAWLFNENDTAQIVDSSGHGFNGRFISKRLDPNAESVTNVQVPVMAANDRLTVWPAHATGKVFRRTLPAAAPVEAKPVTTAKLARNEYESFQTVLSAPARPVTVTAVRAEALQGPGNARIPAAAVSIQQVAYVPLDEPSQCNTSGTHVKGEAAIMFDQITARPGFYPDPLPELKLPLTIAAGHSVPLWITIHTPSDIPGGRYQGQLQITTAEAGILRVPYEIQVWDFVLPERFHTFNSAYFSHRKSPDHERMYRMFSSHYTTPAPSGPSPEIQVQADGTLKINTAEYDRVVEAMMKHPNFNVLYFPGFDCYSIAKAVPLATGKQLWNGIRISETPGRLTPEFRRVFTLYLKQMSDHLRAKNWFDKTRFMVVDEPGLPEDIKLCREFFTLIKSVEPELPVMVTKWPTPENTGSGDLWCLGFFQHKQMRKALAAGHRLEFYPNWHVLIDHELMDSRMLGYLMWKHGITGLLIWRVDYGWDVSNRNVWNNPSYVYPDGRKLWGNGMLLYPDEQYNPVSSMRWESLRDTYEDYEYLYRLNELADALEKTDSAAAAEARRAIRQATDAIVFQYEAHPLESRWLKLRWENNDQVLHKVRANLGTLIEKLTAQLSGKDR